MINLTDKYLLYIEPDLEGPPSEPIEDEWTKASDRLLQMGRVKVVYQGPVHITKCNRRSDNYQRELPNGVIVHSLMTYYLRCYRQYIPESELTKFKLIAETLLRLPKGLLENKTTSDIVSPVITSTDEEMPKLKAVESKPVVKETEAKDEPFSLEERMAKLSEITTETKPTTRTKKKISDGE